MSDIRRDRFGGGASTVRRVSWGAIIAGTLLALAIQLMLGLLGLGIGLSTIDASAGAAAPDIANFASVGGLWSVAVVLIGLFCGAYAAGRLTGSSSWIDAALHGILTWAVSTLVVLLLLASGTSVVVSGAFGAVGGAVQGLGEAASAASPRALQNLPQPIARDVRQLLNGNAGRNTPVAGTAASQANPAQNGAGTGGAGTSEGGSVEGGSAEALATIFAGLRENATPDQRQAATQTIADRSGLSEQQAQQRLQGFQQRYDEVMRQARRSADEAAQAISIASFAAFVALFLGLLVGAAGGLVGRSRRAAI